MKINSKMRIINIKTYLKASVMASKIDRKVTHYLASLKTRHIRKALKGRRLKR